MTTTTPPSLLPSPEILRSLPTARIGEYINTIGFSLGQAVGCEIASGKLSIEAGKRFASRQDHEASLVRDLADTLKAESDERRKQHNVDYEALRKLLFTELDRRDEMNRRLPPNRNARAGGISASIEVYSGSASDRASGRASALTEIAILLEDMAKRLRAAAEQSSESSQLPLDYELARGASSGLRAVIAAAPAGNSDED